MTTFRSAARSRAFSFTILGGGAVARELHLPALRRLGALDRTTLVEPISDVLARARRLFPAIRTEQVTFDAFLSKARNEQESAAIAIVALPNHLHASGVEAALRNGFHVLCEKPLALEQNTCLQLAASASECRRLLAVGMVRRLLPSMQALRGALQEGLLGLLQRVEIEHGGAYAWPAASKAPFERRNGGVLADMGIHYLDLLEDLLGPLAPLAYEDDCRGGVEANCEFRLTASATLPVRIALSRTHTLANRLLFSGAKGEIEIAANQWDGCTFRSYEGSKLHASLRLPQPFRTGPWESTFESCFVEQIEDFAASILDDRKPLVTAADAARTVALIEWAYAQRTGARSAPIPPPEADPRPRLEPAPVVVTGGSGFIGQHLVARLVDLGFDSIRVPVRGYRSCAGIARFGDAELERVDLLDRGQVDAVVQGARHIFHLAYGRDGADAARITIEGTRNVVEAAIAAGAESVVVLSTMYVFGHPDTTDSVDETWPYRPAGGEYGRSKARMERWCLDRARTSRHTRIVVLNPSCVYGPGGQAYTALPAHFTRSGAFCWIEGGRGIANYNYVDNLIDAIMLAAARPEAHAQRFLISDGYCDWRAFLSPLLGAWAAQLPSYSARDLIHQPGLPRASVKDLVRYLSGDLRLIGIVNRMPIAGRLKRTLLRRAPSVRGALLDLREPEAGPALAHRAAAPTYPPSWLAELYGPTQTRFTSMKAKRVLGWEPLVKLEQGQAKARAWLLSANILPLAP